MMPGIFPSLLIALMISAIILVIHFQQKRIPFLAKHPLTPMEVKVIIFFILLWGLLPFLPDHTIDPLLLFNPKKFGLLVLVLTGLQYGSYIATRLFGRRRGLALSGFLGGFVSSTVVFANLSHLLQVHPKLKRAITASALLALTAMLIEVAILIFVVSHQLFLSAIFPLSIMMLASIGLALYLLITQKKDHEKPTSQSPTLNLATVFKLAVFIAATLIFITLAKRYIGTGGMIAVTFLSSLFEVHAISFSTALLYAGKQLSLKNADLLLSTAILATFIAKLFLLWTTTPPRFAIRASACLAFILACGGIAKIIF